MRKINSKGFTLIELLAVITIMGILMIVAIPAVTRTIENSRKDTFLDTVKQYANGTKTMWASDNLVCGTENFPSSAVAAGTYYIEIDSARTDVPQVLESGGKSPWGGRDIKGVMVIKVEDVASTGTRKVTYTPFLSDGIHGVNLTAPASGSSNSTRISSAKEASNLKRGDLQMSKITYNTSVYAGATKCVEA